MITAGNNSGAQSAQEQVQPKKGRKRPHGCLLIKHVLIDPETGEEKPVPSPYGTEAVRVVDIILATR